MSSGRYPAAMRGSQNHGSHPVHSGGFGAPAIGRKQRRTIGGSPRVVHGLRAAQPGGGDDSRSPQPGKRWATGGLPGVAVIGVRSCSRAPLNRCAVQADAMTWCGKIERKARSDCDVIARPRRRVRALTAVTLLACTYAPRSPAPSSLRRMERKQRAGCLRPSLAVSVEHRAPIQHARLLPRACLRRLRPRTGLPSRRAACAMAPHTLRACRCAHRTPPPSPYRAERLRPVDRCSGALTGLSAVRRHNAGLRAGGLPVRRGVPRPAARKPAPA